MHCHFVKSGYVFDVVIASSLVKLYAKCGVFKYAAQLFDEMPDRDVFINSALIDLYFKCGRPHLAENVFRFISRPEIVHWNVMISGYVTVGRYFDALSIYSRMKVAGMKPDAMTFSSSLSACAQLAALEQGKDIHRSVSENELENNEVVMGALLDMYAKCGEINEAFNIFRKLPVRDLISWTSMITAYGSNGQAREALKLFDKMESANVKPDAVTFLAVLSACSHAGLVDEGCYYFGRMINEYNLQPKHEHYSCVIDLLGRIGKVHEAYHLLQSNPDIRDDVELLSSIFSACGLHKEVELREEIAKLLLEKGSDDPSTYVSLSNMYASSSKWKDMRTMRLKMKELSMRKSPGCSWIDIDNRVTMFFAEDTVHRDSEMVRECLGHLYCHMERDEKLEYSETEMSAWVASS
ncbi:Pentatricopeptide repeat-containing protein At5g27110 [Linum perenne]